MQSMDLLVLLGFVLPSILGRVHTVEPDLECPHGWVDGGEMGCFLFQAANVNISWIESLNECEKLGGFLMEPKTADQFQFVSSLALVEESFTGISSWWVGLSDLGHEGTWLWQYSMELADEGIWAKNHPDEKPGNVNDCVALTLSHGDFALEDNKCMESVLHGKMVAPVCQRGGLLTSTSLPPSTTPTTTALPECPLGWKQFERSCFQYFTSTMLFADAETYCIDQAGHLASIHSKDENDFLQTMFSNDVTRSNHWIGGCKNATSWNNFIWTDGSTADYLNWAIGQPDTESYVAIDSRWGWRDLNDDYYPFFCRITY